MDIKEAIELANKAEPETMKKVAAVMAILDKLAPEFTPDVVSDFQKIAEVCDAKLAALSPLAVGVAIGGAAVASLGTALSSDLYDAAKRGLTKGRNFKRIMQANPELKELDPNRLRMVYDSLHRYAPEFTADPLVGGSLLKNMTEATELSGATGVFTALKARKDLIDVRNNQFKVPGLDKVIHSSDRADRAGPPKMKTN